MKLLLVFGIAYIVLIFTWVLYLAIMNLSEHRASLTGVVKFHAYCIVLPVGYVFDAILNLMICLAFLRRPRDWLLTGTLKRYLNTDTGWRSAVAAWMCTNLLDPFDPSGTHCD
jgi:hypothetical protein